ncbi:MAG: ABC transporter ATP-binding protein [Rhodospirillales bacterium]|nr:ABC transporter ATP-binding protein [Rhodospirillales bacterium]
MYLDKRLWAFTAGVRGRIALSVGIGLSAAVVGIARLALLGWLIALVFEGALMAELVGPIVLVAVIMVLRGGLEYLRVMVAHETAARVQVAIRKAIYDKAVALGPAWFGRERTGDVILSVVDGVEQLETYFGEFLPTLLIAVLTPIGIFCFVAFLDLPLAAVLVGAALIALILPMAFHHMDRKASIERSKTYADFGAEFLDAVQGLATLKAFGQSAAKAASLAARASKLAYGTMWVNATNALGRGITDTAIAIGAAAALVFGAWRVEAGQMEMATLLIVLMMGVELFRPLRELRAQLHTGMLGQAAAESIFRVLEAKPMVEETTNPVSADAVEDAPAIQFDNVGFAYPGNEDRAHEGLSFALKPGERVGVVGPSGAGKSSIVRLLLRFYDPQEGAVRISGHDLRDLSFDDLRGKIAVVNQDTYLFHGTVEDNLRFGKPEATQEELEAVCRAANAHDFIMSLPGGYGTVVGERGIRLSGGQRQRIAIARALLRDAPILVLDEALSAVDAENESVIQQALDRLMQGRTTLIFAHRLSSVIDADRILALDHGHIAEEGTHDNLMARRGVYWALMNEQARETGDRRADMFDDEVRVSETRDRDIAAQAAADAEPTDAILRAEGLGWSGAARVLLAFVTVERLKLVFTFVFGVARVVAFIGVGALSALVVARVKAGEPFDDLIVWLAISAPLAGILHWLESWFAHDMAFKLLAEIRGRLFDKLDRLAPAYLLHRRTGDLSAMATQDIETIEYFYAHTIAPAFVAVLVPTIVIAVLLWFGWPMAVALIPFLAIVALSPFLLRKRLDRLGSRAREALGELNAFTVDSIQGLAEIIAFRQIERRGAAFLKIARTVQQVRLPFFRDLTVQMALLEIATGLGGLAIIVAGAMMVVSGDLDVGLLPLFTLLAMSSFLPVSEIAHIGRQLADTLGAARRLHAVNVETVLVDDGPGVPERPHPGGAAITLEAVTYTYRGRRKPALDAINLEIPAGVTVALVGPSGAGKTTLAHLLMRFWDPDSGRIVLDDHDIRDQKIDDLRRHTALVAQDTFLFNDTLRSNIMIARPDASDEGLAAAIRRASLDVVVEGLPGGLETPVGERGMRLSGGQRQRVAIARAFLKDAPILILDEATSHLDAVNEMAVRQALAELMADRTTVVIAHRLSTVRNADLIVAMEGGRILEQGRHDDLVAHGGLYARLVRHQMAAAVAAVR